MKISAKLKEFFFILFPMFTVFRKKKQETEKPVVYNIKTGQPIVIRSEKVFNPYMGGFTKTESKFALDTIKMQIKQEICDELLKGDCFEWETTETPMGTKVSARLIVNKFEK